VLYYLTRTFYWGPDGFTLEIQAGSSADTMAAFTLTFATAVEARETLRSALAAAANARWGSAFESDQVRAIDPIQPDPLLDSDGRPIIRLGSTTRTGLPNVTVQNIADDCASYRRSWLISCPAQTITLRDFCISNDLVGPTGLTFVTGSFFACATEAALGSELQIDMIDRDDVLGYFRLIGASRSKLDKLTDVAGTFLVGEEIRGATCRAKVLAVSDDLLEITFDRWNALGKQDSFVDSETIAGQTSGATATLGEPAFTEGGFLFLQRFIKDEALYGFKSHEERPGGAKPVPPGLYFRVAVFNNHATEDLWIDGTIGLGKK
jgi:hypothetical protein